MTSNLDWIRFGTVAKLCHGNVLDIGCGKGEMAVAIAAFGHNVFGIDPDGKNIQSARELARNLGLDCRFKVWDEHTLPLKDACFHTIVINCPSQEVLFRGLMLKEAVRMCTPGGRIICSFLVNEKQKFSKTSIEAQLKEFGLRSMQWIDNREGHWYIGYGEKATLNIDHLHHDVSEFFPAPFPPDPLDTSEKVSVIISTYNRVHYLPQCLESVLNQTYPNIEIFVVNDGSTDDTDEMIKPYLNDISYIKKENGGKASALNIALPKTSGKYVWIFDDDDIALPKKLEMDVRLFRKNPDVGVVHSHGYMFDNASGEIRSMYMGRAMEPDETILRLLEDTYILNPSMVVKRECYEKVGLYREDLIRSEDYEMWFRLARHFKMRLLDCGTILHRIHKGLRGNKSERFYINTMQSMKYEQKIFSEIYDNFSLQEFYPALGQNPVDPYLQAAALVERARIMSLHGLNDLAEADLCRVVDLLKANNINIKTPFTERMIDIWQQAVLNSNRKFSHSLLKCMRGISVCTENKTDVSTYISKRYFWSFLNNLKLLRLKPSIHRLMISLYFLFLVGKQKLYARGSENGRL
jgi:glycosyltransferase involved in cell wall biosynthesis/precorrin-6B methylase 2